MKLHREIFRHRRASLPIAPIAAFLALAAAGAFMWMCCAIAGEQSSPPPVRVFGVSHAPLVEYNGVMRQLPAGDDLSMGTGQIHNVVDPISAQDAATKNYVDTHGGGGGSIGGSGTATFLPLFSSSTVVANSHVTDSGTTVSFTENVSVPSGATLEQQGDTWLDVATNGAITMSSGLTSDWNVGGGNRQSLVIATGNPAVGNPGNLTSTDTAIDGIVADGRGITPKAGALIVLCQGSSNHGPLVLVTKESSSSLLADQIMIPADGNAAGTSMGLEHRQCTLMVYDEAIGGLWRPVAASDGVLRRFSIGGYFTDTSMGASITNYDAGGTASTHLCGLTRLRWASASSTTMHNWAACNPGDIKEVMVFSGGITLKQNDVTSGGTPFFLPGSTDKTLVSGCTYWIQYDGPNAGYYIVMTSSTSGLAC